MDTGNATANQLGQSSLGSMYSMAMRFWGEEMGGLWPLMLAASAILSCAYATPVSDYPWEWAGLTIKHGANGALGGNVRRIGYTDS